VSSAEQVQVKVIDRLTAVGTVVDDNAIAFGEPSLTGDIGRCGQ